jgi:hypothetical protein
MELTVSRLGPAWDEFHLHEIQTEEERHFFTIVDQDSSELTR